MLSICKSHKSRFPSSVSFFFPIFILKKKLAQDLLLYVVMVVYVTNPLFEMKSVWWDICFNISTGELSLSQSYLSDMAALSEPFAVLEANISSNTSHSNPASSPPACIFTVNPPLLTIGPWSSCSNQNSSSAPQAASPSKLALGPGLLPLTSFESAFMSELLHHLSSSFSANIMSTSAANSKPTTSKEPNNTTFQAISSAISSTVSAAMSSSSNLSPFRNIQSQWPSVIVSDRSNVSHVLSSLWTPYVLFSSLSRYDPSISESNHLLSSSSSTSGGGNMEREFWVRDMFFNLTEHICNLCIDDVALSPLAALNISSFSSSPSTSTPIITTSATTISVPSSTTASISSDSSGGVVSACELNSGSSAEANSAVRRNREIFQFQSQVSFYS